MLGLSIFKFCWFQAAFFAKGQGNKSSGPRQEIGLDYEKRITSPDNIENSTCTHVEEGTLAELAHNYRLDGPIAAACLSLCIYLAAPSYTAGRWGGTETVPGTVLFNREFLYD